MVSDLALQLEMKSNTVLITFIDNAKMLFEAGRRRLLADRKGVGESAEVRGGMI